MSLSSSKFLPAAGSPPRPVRSATYQRLATARRRAGPGAPISVLATRSSLWVRALRCVGLAD